MPASFLLTLVHCVTSHSQSEDCRLAGFSGGWDYRRSVRVREAGAWTGCLFRSLKGGDGCVKYGRFRSEFAELLGQLVCQDATGARRRGVLTSAAAGGQEGESEGEDDRGTRMAVRAWLIVETSSRRSVRRCLSNVAVFRGAGIVSARGLDSCPAGGCITE